MNEKDKEKVEGIIQDIKKVHAHMSSRKSYNSFLSFVKTIFNNEGVIQRKSKELIAIGVAIAVNCEPCILIHIRDAFVNGAAENEIIEAMEIGYEMGGGPSIVKSSFAFKCIDYYKEFGKLH
jgi:AhpD family alkylhydroperoxidase